MGNTNKYIDVCVANEILKHDQCVFQFKLFSFGENRFALQFFCFRCVALQIGMLSFYAFIIAAVQRHDFVQILPRFVKQEQS